uniref:Uncharacterized protein n=1 Tax=Siphoviridae sp. ctWuM9 TaxID=2826364 RepID=A0A8S5MF33_9CAUD|nr:MAG TPA: hypothetical protein [Siphoviridae sp. ctWuM9]
MSSKKETKIANNRLDICNKTLSQISNLKCAIIHNNLEDFFNTFSVISDSCYEFDDYVSIMGDPNSLWYSSSSMLDCLHAIEEAIFSNNLFSTVCNIYTLECMVKTAMDSIDKES